MSAGDIVRRVIIQTEIQPVQGGGSGAAHRQAGDAGGSRPLGGVVGGATRGGPKGGVAGETPEQRTARLHGAAQDALLKKAHREEMNNLRARAAQRLAQNKMEEQQHK
ncbi:MAG TPA: hypothetical protein VLA12_00790, partial [Planctomycetaceae bacterium]|nr:hypothetical protein [Planctomycetaceae bacterium]